MNMSYYQILGVNSKASIEEIKKAYKKEALIWHPDKNSHRREESEDKFKSLSEAYQILIEPSQRENYDLYIHEKNQNRISNNEEFNPSMKYGIKSNYRMPFNDTGYSSPFFFHDPNEIFREFFGGKDPFSSAFFQNDPFFQQQQHFAGGGMNNHFGGPTQDSSFGMHSQSSFFGHHDPFFSNRMTSSSPFSMMNDHFNPMSQHNLTRNLIHQQNLSQNPSRPVSSQFSSMSSSSFGGFRNGGSISQSSRTTIVNGVKQSVTTKTDGSGKTTMETITDDGRGNITKKVEETANGVTRLIESSTNNMRIA